MHPDDMKTGNGIPTTSKIDQDHVLRERSSVHTRGKSVPLSLPLTVHVAAQAMPPPHEAPPGQVATFLPLRVLRRPLRGKQHRRRGRRRRCCIPAFRSVRGSHPRFVTNVRLHRERGRLRPILRLCDRATDVATTSPEHSQHHRSPQRRRWCAAATAGPPPAADGSGFFVPVRGVRHRRQHSLSAAGGGTPKAGSGGSGNRGCNVKQGRKPDQRDEGLAPRGIAGRVSISSWDDIGVVKPVKISIPDQRILSDIYRVLTVRGLEPPPLRRGHDCQAMSTALQPLFSYAVDFICSITFPPSVRTHERAPSTTT